MIRKPSYLNFDLSSQAWQPDVDYRAQAERYPVGRGEQCVLICQPYKDELIGLGNFKSVTEQDARYLIRTLGTDWASLVRDARFLKGHH